MYSILMEMKSEINAQKEEIKELKQINDKNECEKKQM